MQIQIFGIKVEQIKALQYNFTSKNMHQLVDCHANLYCERTIKATVGSKTGRVLHTFTSFTPLQYVFESRQFVLVLTFNATKLRP